MNRFYIIYHLQYLQVFSQEKQENEYSYHQNENWWKRW